MTVPINDCAIADRQLHTPRPSNRIFHLNQRICSVENLLGPGFFLRNIFNAAAKDLPTHNLLDAQVCAPSLLRYTGWLLCYPRPIYPRAAGYMFPHHEHAACRKDRLPRSLILSCRDDAACRSSEGLRSSRPWQRLDSVFVRPSLRVGAAAQNTRSPDSPKTALFRTTLPRGILKECHHVVSRTTWR